MFTLLVTLEVLIAILLVIVILMQSSKGGGLAGTFGGGSAGAVFGVRRTADFLINATQILAAAFILLSLAINIFFLPRAQDFESILQQNATQQPLQTAPQLPPTTPFPTDQTPSNPE
ncbi:MAG: preprotein translocase subunit SecG [Ignavibacteria bacterium]|nr:preprotein translocase subunit SecG [Ignavibacteria bacterium]